MKIRAAIPSKSTLTQAIAIMAGAMSSQPVAAQTMAMVIIEPDDVPGQRKHPEYTPIAFDLAGFDALPSVSFGVAADSNVFARHSTQRSDVYGYLEPRLRLERKDRYNSALVEAQIRQTSYSSLSNQDALEYDIEATYTRGSSNLTSLSANAGYRREVVQRGTAENDLARGAPLVRRVATASLTGRNEFSRVTLNGQLLFSRQIFENMAGSFQPLQRQNFRNVDRLAVRALGSYEISGRSAIFVSAELDDFDYALSPTFQNRDGKNISYTGGIRYSLTRLLYAQVAFGFRKYSFDDPELASVSGLAISAQFRYFPSRLLAVRANIEQGNTINPYDFISPVTVTTTKVEAEYEMRRNLSLSGLIKYVIEDYGGQTYSSQRWDIAGGTQLRISRSLSASVKAIYTQRFTSGGAPFEPFSKMLISATLSVSI